MKSKLHTLLLGASSLLAMSSANAQTTYTWDDSNAANAAATPLDWFTGGANAQGSWSSSPGAQGASAVTNLDTIQFFTNASTSLPYTLTVAKAANVNNDGTAVQLGALTLTGSGGSVNNRTLTQTISGDVLNFSALTGTVNLDATNINLNRNIIYNVNSDIQLGTASSGSVLTFTGNGSSAFNFNGVISELQVGGGSLVKSGTSTVSLTGANTYTGTTTIRRGVLTLSGASGTIASTSALNLSGGTLQLTNTAQVDRFNDAAAITVSAGGGITYNNTSGANVYTETLAAATLSGGQFNVNLATDQTGAGSQTLTLGGLTRTGASNTSAVTFSAAGTGPQITGNKNMIVVSGSGTTTAGQIIGAWATTGTSAALQTDYAVYDGNYVKAADIAANNDETTWGSTENVNLNTTATLTAARTVNTLRYSGAVNNLVLGGNNLETSGLLNGGSGILTLTSTGGALTTGAGGGNLYITTGNAGITSGAAIANNGSDAVTLVKSGSAGNLILNGVNTFTGNIAINAGTLQIGTNNIANGANLGGGNYAGNIFLGAGANLDFQTNANQTLSGIISGDGNLLKRYGGTLTLGDANTYTGKTTLNTLTNGSSPTLVVSSFNSYNGGTPLLASSSLGAPTTLDNATIAMGASNSGPNPVLIYVGTGETTDRSIHFTFNSSSRRILDASGTGPLKFTSNFTAQFPSTGGVTLTGTGIGEIAGNLPALGSGAFIKSGTGTWRLSGTGNAYVNPTTVSDGTLIVTKPRTSEMNAALTVAANKTFIYAPTAAGALNLGSGVLTLGNGATTRIGTALGGGTASESAITSTGAASLSGTGTVDIYGITGVAPTPGTNNLITAASGLDGGTYTLGTVYNNTDFTVSNFARSGTAISVDVTAVTEITSAFWKGGLADNTNVWAASDGSANSNWSTTAGGAVQALTPGSTATVTISATSPTTAPTATVLGADMSILGLVISDTTNGLGLDADGNYLTIGTGGITMDASVPTSTIGANVILGGDQSWTNASANTLDVTGQISGSGNLTKAGTGTLALTGFNSYSGTTTVSAGTLALVGGSQTSAITVASGASLGFTLGSPTTSTSSVDLTSGTVKITGAVDNTSSYQLMRASSFTFTNPLTQLDSPISDYELQLQNSNTELWLVFTGVGGDPFDTWAGTGTLPGTVTFDGDLNGDGVQDGIAFLLGVANPDNDATGNVPTVSEDGSGNLVMVFNCLPSLDRGTAELRVAHSNTLAAFTPTVDQVPDADGTDTDGDVSYVIDTVTEAPLNKVTATIDSSVSAGGKLFGRLEATK